MIKHYAYRRTVLVLLFIPLVIVASCVGFWEALKDARAAFWHECRALARLISDAWKK